MDTSPPLLTKLPSLTKPSAMKLLKPSSTVAFKKSSPRRTTFKGRHKRLMEKRDEECLEKYKLKNLPKLKRENVPDRNVMLNDAPWTKWELAMVPGLSGDSEADMWEKRKGALTGYRKKHICGGHYKVPALYEFAIQTSEHCKRYVVYCKSKDHGNLDF